jgi:hypothetical protein
MDTDRVVHFLRWNFESQKIMLSTQIRGKTYQYYKDDNTEEIGRLKLCGNKEAVWVSDTYFQGPNHNGHNFTYEVFEENADQPDEGFQLQWMDSAVFQLFRKNVIEEIGDVYEPSRSIYNAY